MHLKSHHSVRITLLLFTLTIIFSCEEDEPILSDTELSLTNNSWKKTSRVTTTYANYTLDRIDTARYQNSDELTFYKDYSVELIRVDLDTTLYGTWKLSEDESILSTDLKFELSRTSGYSEFSFYNYNKIIRLSGNELILQTDSLNRAYTTWEDGTPQTTPYTTVIEEYFTPN